MSEQWPVMRLGDVCSFQGGSQPPKSNFIQEPKQGYVRLLQIRDFTSDSKAVYIPKELAKRRCEKTDIMIGRYGASVGQIHRGKEGSYNVALIKTIPDLNLINKDYFYYYLQSPIFQKPLRKVSARAAQAGFSKADINDFEIPIPPLEEQKRIVSILDEAFENISVKLSNAEENMFQAENLFSNELETVFSQRHENWNEMKLDEIGNIQTGTTPKTSERENYGDYISFIKPAAFAKDGAIIHTDDRLSEIGYGKSRPVKPFSVLMVCIGATIGKCGYNVVEVTTNQQINSLTPKNAKLYKFLYYQMLTRKFQHSVVTNAGQSTLPCLSKSKWSKLSLLVPTDDDEIQSIISRFNNLRNECDFLRGKYKRTKNSLVELKQSILQEAFNGSLTKEITA